jgi:N-acyl-D-aspartate/D-glutamate deacylase
VIGGSDAGAHLDMIDTFAFSTAVLAQGVREEKVIGLEAAVHQLTQVPAELLGLKERGLIREGWYADLVIFDPDTVGASDFYMRQDLPANEPRIYADAVGIRDVFVNGVRIIDAGVHTGELPGIALRSGKDTITPVRRHS